MIEVKDLTKNYGAVRALRGVSFEIPQGGVVGLLGPNGAGKSTAMRILTGYIAQTSGEARVDGNDVFDNPLVCQRKIGYLPEGNPLYTELRLMESLRFAAEMHDLHGSARNTAIQNAIEAVGLRGMERRIIGTFSKGFRQRVGLAQALLHEPPILILDEPTSGLDPNQQEDMRKLIRQLGEDRTIILSTHILPEVEASCSRALIINEGELVADGSVEEVRQQAMGGALVMLTVRATAEAVHAAFAGADWVHDVIVDPADDADRLHVKLQVEGIPDHALLEHVASTAFEQSLGLSRLYVDRASLEDVFARLTFVDDATPSGNGSPPPAPAPADAPPAPEASEDS